MAFLDKLIQGKVKGRVALFLDTVYQPKFYGFDIGFVGGTAIGDALEANGACLHFWEQYLILPDGDTLVRVYYSFRHNQWLLIIESDHLPPHKHVDVDIDQAVYAASIEGQKVRITDIQPIASTDTRYKHYHGK